MFKKMIQISLILFLCAEFLMVAAKNECHVNPLAEYKRNIFFQFYYNGEKINRSTSFRDDLTTIPGCRPGNPWLILVHGYSQSCNEQWINNSVKKFTKYRGGCIACMDYSAYSGINAQTPIQQFGSYVNLAARFKPIAKILLLKLKQFQKQKFQPSFGYIFAQSFGSQLALQAGKMFNGLLGNIDACEPAGPGFYPDTWFNNNTAPSWTAARNVQCIHTSALFGTYIYDCRQDWLMGYCGIDQPASTNRLFSNHDLCPTFYNTAFEYNYPAVDNKCCLRTSRTANVTELPKGYKMGYMQRRKGVVNKKTLSALTFKQYPYNKP